MQREIPADNIYTIIKFDKEHSNCEALCFSYYLDHGQIAMVQFAGRDLWGDDWENAAVYDPIDVDGNLKPLPKESFMSWDVDVPNNIISRLTVYGDEKSGHAVKVQYILQKLPMTIEDFMLVETDEERKLLSF